MAENTDGIVPLGGSLFQVVHTAIYCTNPLTMENTVIRGCNPCRNKVNIYIFPFGDTATPQSH